jgi:uncharacterized damage-inducible protein DinB
MSKIPGRGAVTALLEIYRQTISDFKKSIEKIPDSELPVIFDPQTTDENCKSIQSILSHVVHAGFGYATNIHNLKGNKIERPPKTFHLTIKEYLGDLDNVIIYTENIFKEINDHDLDQFDTLKIKSSWGQWYDIEQMMEHAIVHVMRHKRQLGPLIKSVIMG